MGEPAGASAGEPEAADSDRLPLLVHGRPSNALPPPPAPSATVPHPTGNPTELVDAGQRGPYGPSSQTPHSPGPGLPELDSSCLPRGAAIRCPRRPGRPLPPSHPHRPGGRTPDGENQDRSRGRRRRSLSLRRGRVQRRGVRHPGGRLDVRRTDQGQPEQRRPAASAPPASAGRPAATARTGTSDLHLLRPGQSGYRSGRHRPEARQHLRAHHHRRHGDRHASGTYATGTATSSTLTPPRA